mmetsp:Transcript_118958/g.237116  ORF Transcript_118958/g.237116 Transcript_118958/m.237116 type:complete len:263 (-) Transcript_118958:315-1103(-)|eukprot:CAMPEP_0172805380 /NCGR_PEP_ID=MMETSP1075-20121228/5730_1 /TAXON_ID=2916 /ORGANISM="Ceratium fusus, Strain PA161109" /LENGTH=262 /DNA_ID=CAMNT_0013644061 /DNA_START=58 /DNA_END=846 /DNA_ORIENTATION=+
MQHRRSLSPSAQLAGIGTGSPGTSIVQTQLLHQQPGGACRDDNSNGALDSGLSALVARLEGELEAERLARDGLNSRMKQLENSILQERIERQTQLRGFSTELEATMRGLIGRIDEGIAAGATLMRERTDDTEARLRSLIQRVDVGLSAGAAALQEPIKEKGDATFTPGVRSPVRTGSPLRTDAALEVGRQPVSVHGVTGQADVQGVAADRLMKSWEQLRQENAALLEQRSQIQSAGTNRSKNGVPSPWQTYAATPSLVAPKA